eukprot:138190-Prorocentrum_minimum.AAC.1
MCVTDTPSAKSLLAKRGSACRPNVAAGSSSTTAPVSDPNLHIHRGSEGVRGGVRGGPATPLYHKYPAKVQATLISLAPTPPGCHIIDMLEQTGGVLYICLHMPSSVKTCLYDSFTTSLVCTGPPPGVPITARVRARNTPKRPIEKSAAGIIVTGHHRTARARHNTRVKMCVPPAAGRQPA